MCFRVVFTKYMQRSYGWTFYMSYAKSSLYNRGGVLHGYAKSFLYNRGIHIQLV